MRKFPAVLAVSILCQWFSTQLYADYVAVRIEAENYSSKSDRWALTSDDSTPTLEPDPDPPHNNSASGSANLELLPDTRVTHNDPFGGGQDGSFWGGPTDNSPSIHYNVDIPAAGRYFVYVKAYSTGTEDNGIHVGINQTKPESGQRVQLCSKNDWFWTSGQRTDDNHCGVTKTIWLDVPAPGVHKITFYAREDGFEIDQFILLQETHDGSKDCFPTYDDRLRCRDAVTGVTLSLDDLPVSTTVDGEPTPIPASVDLELSIDTEGANYLTGDVADFTVTVTNDDTQTTATNVSAELELPAELMFTAGDCTESGSELLCNFGEVGPGENESVTFSAQIVEDGTHQIEGEVDADQSDSDNSNNTDTATITAETYVPNFDVSLQLVQASNTSVVGSNSEFQLEVTNEGTQTVTNAMVTLQGSDGLTVQTPDNCLPQCEVTGLASGDSRQIPFTVTADAAGMATLQAYIDYSGDENTENNTANLSLTVFEPSIASETESQIISVEAESFNSISPGSTTDSPTWQLIDANYTRSDDGTSALSNGQLDDASSQAYVALLPDSRTVDSDPEISGQTNISDGGVGATLSYKVFFPVAGQYYVHARLRAANTQNASIHVGINNTWPQSGNSLTVCSPDGNWQWTNALQTTAGCDVNTTAVLAVPTPGLHNVMVSQSTDGVELDKLIITSSDSVDPQGTGPVESNLDSNANSQVAVVTSLSATKALPGDNVEYSIVLNNTSDTQSAYGLTIEINGLLPVDLVDAPFDDCVATSDTTVCTISELGAGATVTKSFNLNAAEESEVVLAARVSSAINTQSDDITDVKTLTFTNDVGTGSLSRLSLLFASLLLISGYRRKHS